MRKTVAYLAVSLDGYIADAQGSVAWLDAFADASEEDGYGAFVQTVDTVVMGGRTYRQITEELSPGVWPYDGLHSYVWTRSVAPLPHARRIDGDLAEWLRVQKHGTGKDIWLCGGAELVRQALELDLIDELRLTIIPTLLGAGIPLFGGLTAPKLLELVSHRAENGMVECVYRRRGAAR